MLTAGLDVGSSSVKGAIVEETEGGAIRTVALAAEKLRRRDPVSVARSLFADLLDRAGVSAADLEAHGAVSAAVAEALADGARVRAGVELGVGVTGIAGPDGGSEEKPVGLVFIGIASPAGKAVRRFRFMGTRKTIRERTAQTALDLMRRELAGLPLDASLEG